MTKIAFLDLETVCLEEDTKGDVIWEIGLILRDENNKDTEWRWQVRPNIWKLSEWSRPDFEKRFCVPEGADALCWSPSSPEEGTAVSYRSVAEMLVTFTDKHYIVGAVPDFDTWRGRFFIQRHTSLVPKWVYHIHDVETLSVGYLAGLRKGLGTSLSDFGDFTRLNGWKSDDLYREVGVNPDNYERHTALGDCRLNRDVFDKVMS